MDKAVEIQQQVRHNADDLQSYMRDLQQWKEEMKKKDEELKAEIAPEEQGLPPIRSHKTHKKAKIDVVSTKNKKNKNKKEPKEALKATTPGKRISSYDYAAWDKFDVDKACEELDEDEKKKESEDEELDESEDEDYEELRRKEQALEEKEKGNECLKTGDIEQAIQHYTNGMLCDPVNPIIPANRAMALIRKEFYAAAEQDCDIAIALDNTYVKAFHRRGIARAALNKYELAREDFQEVLKLEPGNKQALFEIRKINQKLRELEVAEKAKNSMPPSSSEEKIEKPQVGRRIKIEEIESTPEDTIKDSKPQATESEDNFKTNLQEENIKGRVYPIEKPPHLRSKKPLVKIEIEEVESDEEEESGKSQGEKGEPTSMKLQNQEEPHSFQPSGAGDAVQANKNSDIESKETDLSHSILEESSANANKDEIESQPETESNIDIPCCPQTSFQFQADWKKLKRNPEALYFYIKQIPCKSYSQIFQQSLESDMLSDILKTYKYFIRDGLDIAEPLQSLTSIRRFGTLILFLSAKDKQTLQELFSHLESNANLSTKEVTTMKKMYGI